MLSGIDIRESFVSFGGTGGPQRGPYLLARCPKNDENVSVSSSRCSSPKHRLGALCYPSRTRSYPPASRPRVASPALVCMWSAAGLNIVVNANVVRVAANSRLPLGVAQHHALCMIHHDPSRLRFPSFVRDVTVQIRRDSAGPCRPALHRLAASTTVYSDLNVYSDWHVHSDCAWRLKRRARHGDGLTAGLGRSKQGLQRDDGLRTAAWPRMIKARNPAYPIAYWQQDKHSLVAVSCLRPSPIVEEGAVVPVCPSWRQYRICADSTS